MKQMKKILLFALAVILVLAFSTGCKGKTTDEASDEPLVIPIGSGGNDGKDGKDGKDGDDGKDGEGKGNVDKNVLPNVWPKAELPPGFPEYPNGSINHVERNPVSPGAMIIIFETDKAAFKTYVKSVEGAGWVPQPGSVNTEFELELVKGTWWVSLTYGLDEDTKIEYAMISAIDFESNMEPLDWPKNLPYDLPPYPDGTIIIAEVDNDNWAMISVIDTSEASFKQYVDMLVKAGWVFDGPTSGFELRAERKDWSVDIIYNKSDSNVIIMTFPVIGYEGD